MVGLPETSRMLVCFLVRSYQLFPCSALVMWGLTFRVVYPLLLLLHILEDVTVSEIF